MKRPGGARCKTHTNHGETQPTDVDHVPIAVTTGPGNASSEGCREPGCPQLFGGSYEVASEETPALPCSSRREPSLPAGSSSRSWASRRPSSAAVGPARKPRGYARPVINDTTGRRHMDVVVALAAAIAGGLLLNQLNVPGGLIIGAMLGCRHRHGRCEPEPRYSRAARRSRVHRSRAPRLGVLVTRDTLGDARSALVPGRDRRGAASSALASRIAFLLRWLGMAPASEFLATSPGGISALSAIAAEQKTGRGRSGRLSPDPGDPRPRLDSGAHPLPHADLRPRLGTTPSGVRSCSRGAPTRTSHQPDAGPMIKHFSVPLRRPPRDGQSWVEAELLPTSAASITSASRTPTGWHATRRS